MGISGGHVAAAWVTLAKCRLPDRCAPEILMLPCMADGRSGCVVLTFGLLAGVCVT
jgi:hypothetical protein